MRSDMDHSFMCKLHHACLYSPATEHHRNAKYITDKIIY